MCGVIDEGELSGDAVSGASTQFGGAAVTAAPAASFVVIPGLLFWHRTVPVLRSCVCPTPFTRLSRSPACLPVLALHCWCLPLG